MKKFTLHEDEIIIALYPRSTQEEILKNLPNRTWRSILERANRLGVPRDLSYVHLEFRSKEGDWTDEEDDLLKTYYELGDKQALLKILPNRTWVSMKTRAQKKEYKFNLLNKKGVTQDIVGKVFNNWKILEHNKSKVKCICIACNISIQEMSRYDVVSGRSKSCGCISRTLAAQTNLEQFGFTSYTQTPEYHIRRKQTCIEKYGAPTNLDSPGQRVVNATKTRQTKIDNGKIMVVDDEKTLGQLCTKTGANYSHALSLLKAQGKTIALKYVYNYDGAKIQYSTEAPFIEVMKEIFPDITKYDKVPLEFKTLHRPDFRLELNNKVLYVNTDGLFWHSTLIKENDKYHLELRKLFQQNNQTIFQFREDELADVKKRNIIKSIIKSYFGIYDKEIFARKCQIKRVSSKNAKEFFEDNHLMGNTPAPTFGLYYKDDLVFAVSVKKKKEGIDIVRLCSKKETKVIGGVSRLFKYIIQQYDPVFIQSFVDLRYATGHSYQNLGFELEGTTLGYNWTNCINTYNRLRCRANMDDRKLTQEQYAKELGWCRIYDAGQAKYIKIFKGDSLPISINQDDQPFDLMPKESKKIFWTIGQRKLLKELFTSGCSRSEIVKRFSFCYPEKTSNSIIRQLSNLKLARSNKTMTSDNLDTKNN